MPSAVSYELLKAKMGAANGIATLDSGGRVPVNQLPQGVFGPYRGQYPTVNALTSAFPTGAIADYAYVTGTNSFWYWNAGLVIPAWVNQLISEADYLNLTPAARAAVPYIVI
ncbi:MAG TPA: hypothetical protein PKY53_00055 [Clostridia bacterium]|jgi:hypothetical protein|nr:hypothetical protein [Clostridia bacterium]